MDEFKRANETAKTIIVRSAKFLVDVADIAPDMLYNFVNDLKNIPEEDMRNLADNIDDVEWDALAQAMGEQFAVVSSDKSDDKEDNVVPIEKYLNA